MSASSSQRVEPVCFSPKLRTVCPRKLKKFLYLSVVLTSIVLTSMLALWANLWNPRCQLCSTFRSARLLRSSPDGLSSTRRNCSSSLAILEKVPLLAVKGTHTLMVSAYLEHRLFRWEVRVIAIVMRNETVAYHCLICCDGQTHNSSAHYDIHSDHFGFPYGTADIMCPVPSACGWPDHVALRRQGVLSDEIDTPSPFIPIQNLQSRLDGDSFPVNFTVCISTMYEFDNVLQLVQSLEMFRLMGVGRVVIYRTSCTAAVQRVLDYYVASGLVEVFPWAVSTHLNVSRGWNSAESPGDLHYFGQIPALNDCVYRYMYRSRYVALQDIDELILPSLAATWDELLRQLEDVYGANVGYRFENHVFWNTIQLSDMKQTPFYAYHKVARWPGVPGINILEHLYREPVHNVEQGQRSNFKIIVNPRTVFSATVHGLLQSDGGCVWVDSNIARLHHTRRPWNTNLSLDELVYDDLILLYVDKLVPAVSAVLHETMNEN